MKRILTILICLQSLFVIFCFGQKTKELKAGQFDIQISTVDTLLNDLFVSCGELPIFPGGKDSLIAFAKRLLYYPQTAINDSVSGKVILEFIVDTCGKIVNEKIFHTIRYDLENVCLTMIRRLPLWIPAKIADRPVNVMFRWTINFKLD